MPPKQRSKSRLNTEQQPVKAWEQALQLAIFSEEVWAYFRWIVVLFTSFTLIWVAQRYR